VVPSRRSIPLTRPLDLGATLSVLRRGRGDPSFRLDGTGAWRATRTPDGPATLHLVHAGDRVEAEAWGPGAAWALEAAPGVVGAGDDPSGFAPAHPVLVDLHRRHPGLRVVRTGRVLEALVPTILEQKVTGAEAFASYRLLLRALGEPAPGPAGAAGMVVAPEAAAVAAAPSWVFHRWGVERKRADTVRRACDRAPRVEEAAAMPLADAYRRLQAFPGVGPWSAAEVGLVALGDADAVPVGDYHLPSVVSWALTGERRGTDERMLELLEPYRGHRGRVLRLLTVGGAFPPRRGSRMPIRGIARI
jgi:hypothetical protein